MNRIGGRKLELVCVLCNEALADLDKACTGLTERKENKHNPQSGLTDNEESTAEATPGYVEGIAKGLYNHAGYHSITNECQKDVVATKCGHMFHQGCLRKHVHKTLIEGKGGSLFCPICTRPFQMNRLWPVVIPPTKAQRERYLQLKMMKDQNVDMVQQLKQIRVKIAEEEARLQKLKQNAEHCLDDIQQKQKLLDSVNGPTNKEMAELTKIHMKRQEILHVVTQHNADLLKLLAEESNISSTTAENLFGTGLHSQSFANTVNNNIHPDCNQNYLSSSAGSRSRSRSRSRSKNPTTFGEVGVCSIDSMSTLPLAASTKISRKSRKSGEKKKTKKKSRKHQKSKNDEHVAQELTKNVGKMHHNQNPVPSKVMSTENVDLPKGFQQRTGFPKGDCGTADTLTRWNMESMKALMSPGSSIYEGAGKGNNPNDPVPLYQSRNPRQVSNPNFVDIGNEMESAKDSMHMLLARRPPMM